MIESRGRGTNDDGSDCRESGDYGHLYLLHTSFIELWSFMLITIQVRSYYRQILHLCKHLPKEQSEVSLVQAKHIILAALNLYHSDFVFSGSKWIPNEFRC